MSDASKEVISAIAVPFLILAAIGMLVFILWGGAWIVEGFRLLPWPNWTPRP